MGNADEVKQVLLDRIESGRLRRTLGGAPRDYVLRRRIEVAQRLMLTTPETLSAIAVSCGMCDQSHFTRSFHRMVGETPYTRRRTRRGLLKINAPRRALQEQDRLASHVSQWKPAARTTSAASREALTP